MKYKSKQITVIIANYNSEWNKIKSTILSVVLQEDVDIEIIISDDSSSIFFESEIRKLLESYSFSNYTIIRNEINVGTVKNIYNALCLASGEYTYVISPGDLFFERKTLSRLMIFAQENKVDICFGDYVPYSSNTQSEISIMDMKAIYPKWPDIYEKNISVLSMFEAFMYGNYIVGACFFRKTKVFLKYLEIIKDLNNIADDSGIMAEKKEDIITKTLETPIEEIEFSVRTYNCLKRANINTVQDLIDKREAEVTKIRNLGKKSLKEVIDKVNEMGLKFHE